MNLSRALLLVAVTLGLVVSCGSGPASQPPSGVTPVAAAVGLGFTPRLDAAQLEALKAHYGDQTRINTLAPVVERVRLDTVDALLRGVPSAAMPTDSAGNAINGLDEGWAVLTNRQANGQPAGWASALVYYRDGRPDPDTVASVTLHPQGGRQVTVVNGDDTTGTQFLITLADSADPASGYVVNTALPGGTPVNPGLRGIYTVADAQRHDEAALQALADGYLQLFGKRLLR
ncbi:hypothetical protein JNJ66_02620 [Candidatus Saccharibacteria bacterium]|nr:hypothetical protein [Candidatus Saccharibacteria bacterium]